MKTNHNHFINLAFNIARINLGKTKKNPSVGCVVVKDNSVISSGVTSVGGRPHAEFNAVKGKKDISGADFYITMEPCTHYGLTPPCTNLIEKTKFNRVYFSFYDEDIRTTKKARNILIKKDIKVIRKKTKLFNDFYNSYFLSKKKSLPQIDAKIAFSKDYYSISKKSRWITNDQSRKRVHLIRSQYDGILSTSKSINKDNALLNCRILGLNNTKPDLIIVDVKLKIKLNLKIFNKRNKRKIIIITSIKKGKKISLLRKRGVKFLLISEKNYPMDLSNLFKQLNNLGYCRILVESGLVFLNELLKKNIISNLYLFKSSTNLGKYGKNNASCKLVKRLKLSNKINVNLGNDNLYKLRIK